MHWTARQWIVETDTEPTAHTTEAISPTSTAVTVSAPIEPGAWYLMDDETVMVSHYTEQHHAGIVRGWAASTVQAHPEGTPMYRQRIVTK